MDMDNAAAFLAGSILYGMGIVFGLACLVCINNILHKYWRPVKIWLPHYMSDQHRFATVEEMEKIAPIMEEQTTSKKK
jgi:hypothetical protein